MTSREISIIKKWKLKTTKHKIPTVKINKDERPLTLELDGFVNHHQKIEIISNSTALMVLISKTPVLISIWLLTTSLLVSLEIASKINSSLLSIVLVLTFSSGMMIIVIYTSSSTPNEIKNKQLKKVIPVLVRSMLVRTDALPKWGSIMIKWFSPVPYILIMTVILIISIASLADNSSNPTESMQSTF